MTELCKLGRKYGTDKFIRYTPFYHEILKDRRDIRKVLEFGIGSPADLKSNLDTVGIVGDQMGASLYMWQEYFPKAEIFALDNCPEKFVNRGRIHSFYCDQGVESSYQEAIRNIGNDFDLIIEDGCHIRALQLLALQQLYPLVKSGGIYIMEDLGAPPYSWLDEFVPYSFELKTFGDKAAVAVLRKL